jgi:hypothetical protein
MLHQAHNTNTAMFPQPEVPSGIVRRDKHVLRYDTNHLAATVRMESPSSSSSSSRNLPAFATLTNDEDRERKAETNLPGTYSVVVTPKSFADLPEYVVSSGDSSTRGQTSARRNARTASGSSNRTSPDPNVVVLDRFEDLSPSTSLASPLIPQFRQVGLPETLQHMSLSMPPSSTTPSQASTPVAFIPAAEGRLVSHFRRYIVTRLVPKDIEDNYGVGSVPIRDIFENEATRFSPVSNILSIVDRADVADSREAPPCYMCPECTQPQLSWTSHSGRSNRTLRSSSVSANPNIVGQRSTIGRRLPKTLPSLHLRHLHDRRCEQPRCCHVG